MKEIKAYFRAAMASRVIQALTRQDDIDFSLIEVRGISHGLPEEAYEYSMKLGEAFVSMVKLEIICKDENVERLAELIRGAASTGRRGDGAIFIKGVEDAIRIRNGERGESILSW